MATSMIHVRMDDQLKEQATAALSKMGLNTSDAVRILFKRIVAEQSFPLELKVPNAETRQAMAESEQMIRDGRARFTSAEEVFEALDRGE